jgi:hypothetical protein
MTDDSTTPPTLPIIFGLVCFLLGSIIIGAQIGIVPTERGAFFAPPLVISSLGVGLILLAIVSWIPVRAPAFIRGFLGLVTLLLVAVVCNWSAFAPAVRYASNYQIGPFFGGGEDQVGGRIVFGLVAVVIDAVIIGWILSLLVRAFRKIR